MMSTVKQDFFIILPFDQDRQRTRPRVLCLLVFISGDGRRHTWVPPYIIFVGQGPCALPEVREKSGRADVGSELSAASGRGSEVSEWPRSKF